MNTIVPKLDDIVELSCGCTGITINSSESSLRIITIKTTTQGIASNCKNRTIGGWRRVAVGHIVKVTRIMREKDIII